MSRVGEIKQETSGKPSLDPPSPLRPLPFSPLPRFRFSRLLLLFGGHAYRLRLLASNRLLRFQTSSSLRAPAHLQLSLRRPRSLRGGARWDLETLRGARGPLTLFKPLDSLTSLWAPLNLGGGAVRCGGLGPAPTASLDGRSRPVLRGPEHPSPCAPGRTLSW